MPQTKTSNDRVLLVYDGPGTLNCLKGYLRAQSMEVFCVDGRAPDAAAQVMKHAADAVVMIYDQDESRIVQAVRQLGQILPTSLLLTTSLHNKAVDFYQGQSRVGQAKSLGAALAMYRCIDNANLHADQRLEAA